MPSIEELTVAAVRAAMAPGYQRDEVGVELLQKAASSATALRIARARVERGAGWRAGPIGQRAREALTHAIELAERSDSIDLTEVDLTDTTADGDLVEPPTAAESATPSYDTQASA